MKQGDKIEIVWVDATMHQSNGMSFGEAMSIPLVERANIGYFVGDDSGVFRICFGKLVDPCEGEDFASDVLVIPSTDVKEIRKLK